MNRFEEIGNAVSDIELTKAGEAPLVRFTLAVKRQYKNKEGNYDTDFIQFKAWDKTAELLSKYVKKGDKVFVAGEIQTSTSEKDGDKRYFTDLVVNEVEFLSSKKAEQTESK